MRYTGLIGLIAVLSLGGSCSSSEQAGKAKGEEASQTAEIKTSTGGPMYFKTGLWRIRMRMESLERMGLKVEIPETQTEFCMDEQMAQAKRAPFGGVPTEGQSPMPDCKFENLRIKDGRMQYDLVCPDMRAEVDIKFSETKFEGEYKMRRGETEVMGFRMIGEHVGECNLSSDKNPK
ncbi:MAG: DUF3617 domain-containing protein [Bacteroidia bacterium]|nr:DUF3617 domain-containing protein [Bacteroidia bacterium]